MQSGVSFPPPLDEGREYLLLLVRALGLVDLLHEGAQVVERNLGGNISSVRWRLNAAV